MYFQNALREIISRNSFYASEISIFKAIHKWAEDSEEQNVEEIMKCVRLPLMSLEELLNEVRPSSLVSADAILDAIKVKNESRSIQLNYRGILGKLRSVCL